jgi:alpha-tubulin suppressor-like RCC1 family protein
MQRAGTAAGLSYVEVAAGEDHVLARRSDGLVVAWGDNTYGQCNVPSPPPGLSYVEVAAGKQHAAARRSDGNVVAWATTRSVSAACPRCPPACPTSQ